MNDFQAIADRVEIEALRGEFTDAAMMRDRHRIASLFTPDGVLRMPNVPVELVGREEILAGGERLHSQWDFFVQTTHPGAIRLDGDTATGRAYIQELMRLRDGSSHLNYAVYQSGEHRQLVDERKMLAMLQKAGFGSAARSEYQPEIDSADPVRRRYSAYYQAVR